METIIRHETPQDYHQVEDVAREAFWNLYFPGCHEHYVVHKLRQHPDYLPELSFILEVDGQLAGGIFYTRAKIKTARQTELAAVSFGPVFIHPRYHRQGLGRQLITHSIAVAKKMGHPAIITLGYPYHYAPYGFVGGKKYGIAMEDGKFYQGLLVLPLYPGGLDGWSGQAVFSQVFEVAEEDVEAFDKAFSPKEKKYQPSQDEFKAASTCLDD